MIYTHDLTAPPSLRKRVASAKKRKSNATGKKKNKTKLVAILGRSPGETLTLEERSAYGFEAQTRKCIKHFGDRFGKEGWEAVAWHHREVFARKSKGGAKQLSNLCAEANS